MYLSLLDLIWPKALLVYLLDWSAVSFFEPSSLGMSKDLCYAPAVLQIVFLDLLTDSF